MKLIGESGSPSDQGSSQLRLARPAMGLFSEQKPYSAVTNWVEQLCSEQYEEDDYTGVPDLCDVARLQDTGPAEAARAIRKKLKYGNIHRQARALTLLDALLQNGDRRVKLAIASDEPLLERLRVLVSDPTTDSHVKRKAVELFGSWSLNFRNEKGMERLTGLRSQMPTKKRVVQPVRPPTPENEPTSPSSSSRRASHSTSQPAPPPVKTLPVSHKKTKSKDNSKSKTSYKPINFEKERHLVLQTIAASNQSATNLTNSLKRLNRETTQPSADPQIQQLYAQCRKLRKDVLIYIQRTENEEWVGTLINANEELVQALSHYERASKPIEQDSDSDAWSASDSDGEGSKVGPQKRTSTGGSSSIAEDLASRLRATSLSKEVPPPRPPRPVAVESPPAKPPRPMPMTSANARGKQPVDDDDDDPFGDEHVIETPGNDRKGWLQL